MKSTWKRCLTEAELEDFEKNFSHAKRFRAALDKLLAAEEVTHLNSLLSEKNFESPAWSEKTAETMGYLKMVRKIRDLI